MRLAFDQLSITAPCLDILHVKETYSAQVVWEKSLTNLKWNSHSFH